MEPPAPRGAGRCDGRGRLLTCLAQRRLTLGASLTWKTLPAAARLYVVVAIVVGTVPLLVALVLDPPRVDATLAAVLLFAGAVASHKLVFVGRPGEGRSHTHQMSTMSLAFPVVLGA